MVTPYLELPEEEVADLQAWLDKPTTESIQRMDHLFDMEDRSDVLHFA